MPVQQFLNVRWIEDAAFPASAREKHVAHEAVQFASEPVSERHRESLLRTVNHLIRNNGSHRPLEQVLAPVAVQATKESVLRGLAVDMKAAYKLESEISSMVFQTEDAKEGPRAFAEKRPPRWQGR